MVSAERRKQIKVRMAEIRAEVEGYSAELAEDDDPSPRPAQPERPSGRRHRRWLHPVR